MVPPLKHPQFQTLIDRLNTQVIARAATRIPTFQTLIDRLNTILLNIVYFHI